MKSKEVTLDKFERETFSEEFLAEAQVEYDRISRAAQAKYPIQLHWVKDEDGGYWYAYHPDWGYSACSSVGDTVQEAVANLDLVRADLMVYYAEQGRPLPVMSCPPWAVEVQAVGVGKTMEECFSEINNQEDV